MNGRTAPESTAPGSTASEHVLLDDPGPARERGAVLLDHRAAQRAELEALRDVPPEVRSDPGSTWVHYPWRGAVVGVLGVEAFRLLRLDRNRNKITRDEQRRLAGLRVGIAGLSVGHAVAHTLALEGVCGHLRLADLDAIDTSNLNRVPASLLDVGVNKAVVAARRIAELDPFLDVRVVPDGVTAANLAAFVDGLDVLVEECDSLDVKVMLREEARRRGVPVVMGTSDRGLLDVERYDLEPDRAPFHGALAGADSTTLGGLSTREKVPYVLRILDAARLSARLAASMVEVGRTVTTWPQLGTDVTLNAAAVVAAVRRLGLGRPLRSGRVRVDLDEHLDGIAEPAPPRAPDPDPDPDPVVDPAPAVPAPRVARDDLVATVVEAIRRAPSGGNIQPWRVESDGGGVRLFLDRARTTTMDVAYRGSYVALGAALFNARAAASAAGALGEVTLFGGSQRSGDQPPDLVAELRFAPAGAPRSEERLSRAWPWVRARGTDRAHGRPQPVPTAVVEALRAAAAEESAGLHVAEPGPAFTTAGEALAASDRLRQLTATLHREMFAELVGPGADTGIDVGTLGLDASDRVTLDVIGRDDVSALLADWDAGTALSEDTRDRVASSSALAVVTTAGSTPADFVRGGAGMEAVWVEAQRRGLAVHPVSPVFLYAAGPGDLATLSAPYAEHLARLRSAFRSAMGVPPAESLVLVLRLSHAHGVPPRSRRRPVGEIHHAP